MLKSDAHPDKLHDLLRRVSDGDSAAFRDLHASSARRLLPFALRIVRSRDLAEEVLQESFIAIWRDAARFDGARSAPMTWMITIVRNKAIDYVRANALRERMTDADLYDASAGFLDPSAGPCELVELGQRRRDIEVGLTLLEIRAREAIELAFFEELSHGEVASRMTIPLGTVKTWIRRGCKQIRVHLERRPLSGSFQGHAAP